MKLFISYAHVDDQFMNWLKNGLKQSNFDVWIDREDIKGGDNWMKAIVEGINTSDAFIVVLSANSVASRNVKIEVSLAFQANKKMVPANAQAHQLPDDLKYQLSGVQYVDFTTGDYQGAYNQLVNALRGTSAPATFIPQQQQQLQQQYAVSQNYFQPVGRWQVQLRLWQFMAGGEFIFMPSGLFTGQLNTPQGSIQVQGNWGMQGNQLMFQGGMIYVAMPTNWWPYGFMLMITFANANAFGGYTSAGEEVVFQRVG